MHPAHGKHFQFATLRDQLRWIKQQNLKFSEEMSHDNRDCASSMSRTGVKTGLTLMSVPHDSNIQITTDVIKRSPQVLLLSRM
jgi:hypothetical protein